MNYYLEVLRKYAVFHGRERRRVFWWFVLVHVGILVVLSLFEFLLTGQASVLVGLYNLAVFIPGLAVTVRRLHDTGRTGWWVLIGLIPFFGSLILLIFMLLDSEPGTNQYGPNPKEVPISS
ncbi:MAG TPA: DUF805 domain-containing protein [Acidobacteriota bacterium]|nr:DUF805 domain-containing protein [Acidobacteriota bacterium]